MVKVEIRICTEERDNIMFKWVNEKELAFLRSLESGQWALASPKLKITVISY